MQIYKIMLVYILSITLFSPVFSYSVSSSEDQLPAWNKDWSHHQEIILPISTNNSISKNQPIDIHVNFKNPCWTKNEKETSIRVCCWDGHKWNELESQIYDLNFIKSQYIRECCLVFIVPEYANGNEKYFLFYDDSAKPKPEYPDHLNVEDSVYSFSPISSINVNVKYFGIKEDGYYIYGIGQEGTLLNRAFSQIVVKQKRDRRNIDVLDSDQIVSFAFSYYYGNKEKDESSSDQVLISKEIIIDGNLLVEVGIKSESRKKDVVTTAYYRYYFTPTYEKRLSVRIKHEMKESVVVKGMENIDGRFGMVASFKSRSPAIDKLNVGDIYPYLHFYGENDRINNYRMNLEPESKKREWIVSYKDDADLGDEAWISYGYGERGKTNSIIFSSNKDIVKCGEYERDGIQLKVAQKEYFDFLNAEVDYTSINFGRNSFENGYSHDKEIPDDLIVMFDAELFYSDDGGYEAVRNEAKIFQQLIKHRYFSIDAPFEKEKKKYDLTVFTYFGGTRLSYPRLSNITKKSLPEMWIELCQDNKIVYSSETYKPLFFRLRSYKHFSDIVEGNYLIKLYWKFNNLTKFFTGSKTVKIDRNLRVNIFCTWEYRIKAKFIDQQGNGIQEITAILYDDGIVFDEKISDENGNILFKAPFALGKKYFIKASYKNFIIYEGGVRPSILKNWLKINVEINNLTVNVRDKLNFPPGVEILPTLSKIEIEDIVLVESDIIEPGRYIFERIPSGKYKIQIEYGNLMDEKIVNLPIEGNSIDIEFSPEFILGIDLYDSRVNPIFLDEIDIFIIRDGKKILSNNKYEFILPPAHYEISAYYDEKCIGYKELDLTNDRGIKLLTSLNSQIPTIIFAVVLVFSSVSLFLTIRGSLRLNSFFKILTILIIILSIFQPWWSFYGNSYSPDVERNTMMFLNPQTMVESTEYEDKIIYEIAEMPDLFVDFLHIVIIVSVIVCVLLALSFISEKLNKKLYSFTLMIVGLILLFAIVSTFSIGTSKLTEASVGNVIGHGILNIQLDEQITLNTQWGFSSGFYLIIIAIILIILSTFIEMKRIFTTKRRIY